MTAHTTEPKSDLGTLPEPERKFLLALAQVFQSWPDQKVASQFQISRGFMHKIHSLPEGGKVALRPRSKPGQAAAGAFVLTKTTAPAAAADAVTLDCCMWCFDPILGLYCCQSCP